MAGTHFIRYVAVTRVPLDALTLNENIQALKRCQELLDSVEPINIANDREIGKTTLFLMLKVIRVCKRNAEAKLRREFLVPTLRKRRVKGGGFATSYTRTK
jgi:hypothetical protein